VLGRRVHLVKGSCKKVGVAVNGRVVYI